jgi:hypothetical protein
LSNRVGQFLRLRVFQLGLQEERLGLELLGDSSVGLRAQISSLLHLLCENSPGLMAGG